VSFRRAAGSRTLTTEAASSNGVTSLPLWIGPRDRPLFAWLHVPEGGVVTGAAVICPSMGLEAAYSARTLRALCLRLAHSGWAALRLDYAATGDSVGSWTEPGLVAEWLGNIRVAIDHVRELGAPRVGVVGLRLGATLAAAELERGGAVDDLVLWDACASGGAFLREQTALAAFRRTLPWAVEQADIPPAPGEQGLVEAPGIVFSGATAADLSTVAVSRDERPLASRELVLSREGRKPERAFRDRLAMPHVESTQIAGQEALFDEWAVVPVPTLDRIVSWFAEVGGPVRQLALEDRPETGLHRASVRGGVSERPLEIGPARLFGMLSEPEDGSVRPLPTVVFLNVGLIPHHGPGRLWVELARACAATGNVRCLRVDLNGLGDSPTREGGTELRHIPVGALDDLLDIHRAVTGEGGDVMVMGVCSGADRAIELGLAAPVASICVINPALSFLQWGNTDDTTASEEPSLEEHRTWGTTGPLLSRVMASLAHYRYMVRWVPTPGWWFVKRFLMKQTPVETLGHLVQSGANVLLMLGDGETRRIYRGEQRRLGALAARGGVSLQTVPHLDHSLLERFSHDRVGELFGAYVAGQAAGLSARVIPAGQPDPTDELHPEEEPQRPGRSWS
jgi:hypothetical protein